MERQIVTDLVRTHGTNSPLVISSERNLTVLYEDLGKSVWGYYTCINRIPSIHLNNRLEDFKQLFAAAHELGHNILHPGISTPFLRNQTLFSVDKIERQANRFALHLLIGFEVPEPGEQFEHFLMRCGIPAEFKIFY
ncbi:ImmA/IrrE family metallo-endopeptidase [Paenibacillus daejeonensis]|uniref:ImmA/IrrE family metallo-endopeptidase n=1 Tax=Paenibacillus daejeonensis TaxID=135193 RepID=UPI00037FFF96|nr:ImmA/IrrE family metallo-endopeptidase [Paenibacillus daejeonensis]